MIDREDLDLFHVSDDPYEAFEYLKNTLTAEYLEKAGGKPPKMNGP